MFGGGVVTDVNGSGRHAPFSSIARMADGTLNGRLRPCVAWLYINPYYGLLSLYGRS